MRSDKFLNLPRHIAFIMDGNGRWAKKRGLSRKIGHAEGVKTLEKIVNEVFALKIPYITVYAFSTENWKRDKEEVDSLLDLFRNYFNKYFTKLSEKGIKINVFGDISAFPEDLQQDITRLTAFIPEVINGTLNVAMNYGARSEIIRAVNTAVENGEKVDLYIQGEQKAMVLQDVVVRVGDNCAMDIHLDTDEANAARVPKDGKALLVKQEK